MRGSFLDNTTLMNKSPHAHIEMKATFATWTGFEMLLHDSNFLNAELPTNIEMKTSDTLITVHNDYPPRLARPSFNISVYSNIIGRTFIPETIRIYCKYTG
jgi:hypothetical protein